MEKASLQTKVRGVSERVKLLEDILVAYVKAHGDLIKYLTVSRNRDRLRAAASGGMGADKAVQILDGAFKEVDRAAARHRAMLKRMHAINDEETGKTEFHKDSVVLPPYPPLKDADGNPLRRPLFPAQASQEEKEHVRRTEEMFEVPKDGTVLVGVEDKRPQKLNPLVEEFVEGLEATKKHVTATVQDILELKKAEIRSCRDETPLISAKKSPDLIKNGVISDENPVDGT